MAKKSHKSSPRLRKENSSCMGGLISMFDFRRGRSTRRLLSDKKRKIARNLGVSYSSSEDDLPCNREENQWDAENLANSSDAEADKVNLGVISIQALMEDEMSSAHHSRKGSSSKIEWLKTELELDTNPEESHNEQAKNSLVGSDDHSHDFNVSPKLISQQPDYPNISEVLESDIDVAAFMVDYCSTSFQFKDDQLEFKNKTDQHPSRVSIEDLQNDELDSESLSVLQKAIVDIARTILRTNSRKPVGKNDDQRAEEFRNALEMLNSNKDLFIKLLGDSNSIIRKHIEDLQNTRVVKNSKIDENQSLGESRGSKQFKKQIGHHFFRKREDLTEANQSDECSSDAKVVNRIVVLKPTIARYQNPSNTVSSTSSLQSPCGLENREDRGRLSSHFSLKEIRRRFKNAVDASKRERRSIAIDGIVHKIPYGKQMSSKNEISCGREAVGSEDEKKSNIKEIQKKNEHSFSANIFWKHKKLNKNAAPQMEFSEAAFYNEARKHLSELLPMEREAESLPAIQASKSLGRILSFSGFNYFSPGLSLAREKEPESPREKTSLFLCHSNQNFDAKCLSPLRPKQSLPNTSKSQEAKNGSMEITEVEDCEEDSQVEAQIVSISDGDLLPTGSFEEGFSMLLEPVKFEEMSQPSTPTASSSAVLQEPRDTDCAMDNAGRPSPISVLEHLHFEDESSPASFIAEHGTSAERKTRPIEPHIDTSAAASDSIDSDPNATTCLEFDEANLFDELEISYGLFINDPKFLFDLIDEVVSEIQERHLSCTRWVSLLKPAIRPPQKQEDFVTEARRRMNRHLDAQFPITLEQALKKDFDCGTWCDNLQLESEDVVSEIGNEILDHLFEETALELWD